MVDLAKHASHIATRLKFLATHAAGGNRLEEADTIAALAQIAEALRSAAAAGAAVPRSSAPLSAPSSNKGKPASSATRQRVFIQHGARSRR